MAIKEVLHTDLAPAAVGPYSQAIAANGFVFTSGQVPIDPRPPASCPTSTTLLHSTVCTRSTSRKALRLVPALK